MAPIDPPDYGDPNDPHADEPDEPAAVQVPFALDFDGPTLRGQLPKFKPGRGRAGWTVGTFPSLAKARAFVAAHPESELPCWRRPDFLRG